MKNIVLSIEDYKKLYSVPDEVADNLNEYCAEFEKWLRKSPDAKRFRVNSCVVTYNEGDFIEYLNTYKFPKEKSVFVKNLGRFDRRAKLPAPYCDYPERSF